MYSSAALSQVKLFALFIIFPLDGGIYSDAYLFQKLLSCKPVQNHQSNKQHCHRLREGW